MGFNWQGAMSGLLAEGGRQAHQYADRLQAAESKKLEEQVKARREEALLKKEAALKTLGYDLEGKPWTRGEYDTADEKPTLYGSGLARPTSEAGPKYQTYQDYIKMGYGPGEARELAAGKKAQEDEIVGYSSEGGPIYKSQYKPGMKLYKDQLGREDPKQEMTESAAKKEIIRVGEKIAKLKAGNLINEEDMKELIKTSPFVAAFIGNDEQIQPEDRKALIKSFEDYQQWLQQFIRSATPHKPEIGDETNNPPPVIKPGGGGLLQTEAGAPLDEKTEEQSDDAQINELIDYLMRPDEKNLSERKAEPVLKKPKKKKNDWVPYRDRFPVRD